MAYSDKVVDHYQNPRNVGAFGSSGEVKERSDVGVGIVGAPAPRRGARDQEFARHRG